MQWIVLVPIISTLVYAGPPVFTNYPVSHSKATSFRDEINICGSTNGIDDKVYWELLMKKPESLGWCLGNPV
jgi:hypothetical protein